MNDTRCSAKLIWFNCPLQLTHERKQLVACGVKSPVLVNPGTLVKWADRREITLIRAKTALNQIHTLI